MKQKILNLKTKLLLVELPEDIVAPEKSDNICIIKGVICFRTSKMKPTMRSLGKLTDITENQFNEWAARFYGTEWDPEIMYRDFTNDFHYYLTAKESFFSYLESQKIIFSNPLADYEGQMKDFRKQFEEAEQKVWQLSQTYLFEILK